MLLYSRYLISHSTDSLKASSFAAFTVGSLCTLGCRIALNKLRNTNGNLTKTHQITASSESMRYTLIVGPAIPGREARKFLICFFTHGLWEHFIMLATIYQERGLALLNVNLRRKFQQVFGNYLRTTHIQIFWFEKRRMGNYGRLNNIFECKIESKAG